MAMLLGQLYAKALSAVRFAKVWDGVEGQIKMASRSESRRITIKHDKVLPAVGPSRHQLGPLRNEIDLLKLLLPGTDSKRCIDVSRCLATATTTKHS